MTDILAGRLPSVLGVILAILACGPAVPTEEPHIAGIAIERTAFRVTLADGRVLSGAEIVGLTLPLDDGRGGAAALRIDAMQRDPRDASGETTLYGLSLGDPATGEWRDLCQPDPYGERWGFPLASAEGGFTLTCTSGARAKCIRFGYRPWQEDLRELHEACIHMVRADYCGDGTPHTRDGTLIGLYDRRGVVADRPIAGMRFEAAWGPQGALCLARTRIPEVATLAEVLAQCPRLRQAPNGVACTEAATAGALLFNRSY